MLKTKQWEVLKSQYQMEFFTLNMFPKNLNKTSYNRRRSR